MKKYLIALVLFWFCFGFIQQQHLAVIAKKNSADYCGSITWPGLTSPDFMLDVDNTDNDLYACISGDVETGNANTAHCTPGTTSDAQSSGHSGGQAICSASGTITYDNSTSYVDIDQGEIRATIWFSDGSGTSEFIFIGDAIDQVSVRLGAGEALVARILGSGGASTASNSIDISSAIGTYWVDIYVQWDESRSAADEVTINARIQDGTPTWIGWANSDDTDNFTGNASNQPGADEVMLGGIDDNSHNTIIDDIEINNTLPDGWEPAL